MKAVQPVANSTETVESEMCEHLESERVGDKVAGESRSTILVTGANGFIGQRVVNCLLEKGVRSVRRFVRPTAGCTGAAGVNADDAWMRDGIETVEGNLLSATDCRSAMKDVSIVYHLAAGRGEKSFPDAYANSVVTTRNLLDACVAMGGIRRFVNVSSFAVYTNRNTRSGRLLDEACPVEACPANRFNAYCFAKVSQEELVQQYVHKYQVPCVTVRPGIVYGPGNEQIHGRVGIGTFGLFLHLGGPNRIPLSYVDNCAEAIVLAGTADGVDGEIFNLVDDDLPTSREFLRAYKREVRRFPSVYLPHAASYLGCWLWERLAGWSLGQLPPVFSRAAWHANWKRTTYTNEKAKRRLGWIQRVSTQDALQKYFAACRRKEAHA